MQCIEGLSTNWMDHRVYGLQRAYLHTVQTTQYVVYRRIIYKLYISQSMQCIEGLSTNCIDHIVCSVQRGSSIKLCRPHMQYKIQRGLIYNLYRPQSMQRFQHQKKSNRFRCVQRDQEQPILLDRYGRVGQRSLRWTHYMFN